MVLCRGHKVIVSKEFDCRSPSVSMYIHVRGFAKRQRVVTCDVAFDAEGDGVSGLGENLVRLVQRLVLQVFTVDRQNSVSLLQNAASAQNNIRKRFE